MARTAKEEQPFARRNWISPVAPDATSMAHTAFARAGFLDPTLVLRWEEIAGPETARLAVPIRFSEGPHGGVLTLKAEPGAALFLQHETRPLCERINGYLGRPAVARLKFVQGALASRPPPPARRLRLFRCRGRFAAARTAQEGPQDVDLFALRLGEVRFSRRGKGRHLLLALGNNVRDDRLNVAVGKGIAAAFDRRHHGAQGRNPPLVFGGRRFERVAQSVLQGHPSLHILSIESGRSSGTHNSPTPAGSGKAQ